MSKANHMDKASEPRSVTSSLYRLQQDFVNFNRSSCKIH